MQFKNETISEYFLAHLPAQFTVTLADMPFDSESNSDSSNRFPIEFEATLGVPGLDQPCQPTMEVFSDDEPEVEGYDSERHSDEFDSDWVGSSSAKVASDQDRRHAHLLNFFMGLFLGTKVSSRGSVIAN